MKRRLPGAYREALRYPLPTRIVNGAADGTRTRNSQLGRLELYQLNYGRTVVGPAGFEPTTLCSQSRCATKLRYGPTLPG